MGTGTNRLDEALGNNKKKKEKIEANQKMGKKVF